MQPISPFELTINSHALYSLNWANQWQAYPLKKQTLKDHQLTLVFEKQEDLNTTIQAKLIVDLTSNSIHDKSSYNCQYHWIWGHDPITNEGQAILSIKNNAITIFPEGYASITFWKIDRLINGNP